MPCFAGTDEKGKVVKEWNTRRMEYKPRMTSFALLMINTGSAQPNIKNITHVSHRQCQNFFRSGQGQP
jgi:hypothetical protein